MSAFKLSLLTLAATAVLTAASLGPASAQVRVVPIFHTQSAGGAEEVGYRDRYRYGYRPYYRRYGYYRPRYRPMAIRSTSRRIRCGAISGPRGSTTKLAREEAEKESDAPGGACGRRMCP